MPGIAENYKTLIWIPSADLDNSSLVPVWREITKLLKYVDIKLALNNEFPKYVSTYFQQLSKENNRFQLVETYEEIACDLVLVDTLEMFEKFKYISKKCFLFQSPHSKLIYDVKAYTAIEEIEQDLLHTLPDSIVAPPKISPLKIEGISKVLIAPQSQLMEQQAIEELASHKIQELLIIKPIGNLSIHPGVQIFRDLQDFQRNGEFQEDRFYLVQFLPAELDFEGRLELQKTLGQSSEIDMISPVTLKPHPLAKVHLFIKPEKYPVGQNLDVQGLREFLRKTNQLEFIVVPELDQAIVLCNYQAIQVLTQFGIGEFLKSSQLRKAYATSALLVD